MQILDGGILDISKWSTNTPVGCIPEFERVSIAIEGAFKKIVLLTHPFWDADIGCQFEELASVGGAVDHVVGQRVLVVRWTDEVWVGLGAGAAAKLCPSRLPKGEEGEHKE